MRKLGLTALLFGAAAVAAACGGGDSTADRVELPVDGGGADVETAPPDAAAGTVQDFEDCNVNTDCANPDSECIPIGFLNGMPKVCMPRCNASTDCPFSTYCWPDGGGLLGSSAALMANHCWYSLCGEVFGPQGNPRSRTGEPCQLGGESGAPASDQLPGWCLPIEDQSFGQCLEAGNVGPGGTCDFSNQTRDGQNCDQTTLCIGQSGAATGTCAQICDPTKILTGEATGCTTSGETCFDSSAINTYNDGSTARQTIGFCTDVIACGTIAANTCPADASGNPQGCAPTNSLRPTGICDPVNGGPVAAGGTCDQNNRCQSGLICNGTCQNICKTPRTACTSNADCAPAETCDTTAGRCVLPYSDGPDFTCTSGTTCQKLLWDEGFDGQQGTPDDNFTADWGSCQ